MLEYSKCIFEDYLDKHPKYLFPETVKHALGDLDDLKPSVSEIQIHHHGNESTMVMEGSNPWFCYQASFREQTLPISASCISGSSVQFNGVDVPRNSEKLSSRKENVNLIYHFKSKPILQEVEVHQRVRHHYCVYIKQP